MVPVMCSTSPRVVDCVEAREVHGQVEVSPLIVSAQLLLEALPFELYRLPDYLRSPVLGNNAPEKGQGCEGVEDGVPCCLRRGRQLRRWACAACPAALSNAALVGIHCRQ